MPRTNRWWNHESTRYAKEHEQLQIVSMQIQRDAKQKKTGWCPITTYIGVGKQA